MAMDTPRDRTNPDEPGRRPAAERIYRDWLERRLHGDAESFARLCEHHAGERGELERWHEEVGRVERLFSEIAPRSVAERVQARFGADVDPRVELEPEESAGDFTRAVLARLARRGPTSTRYRLKGQMAEGGMGAILRVWDEDLRRHLAMKVILGRTPTSGDATPEIDRRMLARFLEEAQVTGQLDHPGIVPVHELGLDPSGRAFFTMKLVKGFDLRVAYEHVRSGNDGWTQARLLGVLVKVCEAMSYAHDKGVIHRDLKPANVMVGRYGEVYVMDWGLARVLDREDARDIRLRVEESASATGLRSARTDASDSPDSPLFTMDGEVVGTPAYMPPEQAHGQLDAMGPHSDVYAVGAMLYHLIAGHMPYLREGERASNYAIWRWVKEGPPTSLDREAPQAPPELVAICERAMARDPKARYENMGALAVDLMAYQEGRVVRAYEVGAWAEGRKWVRRNRALASAAAAALLAVVVGGLTAWVLKTQAQLASASADLAAGEARRSAELAEQREQEARSASERLAASVAALEAQRQEADTRRQEAEASAQRARSAQYRATILEAQRALAGNEIDRARMLLLSCPESERHFEWGHLWIQLDQSYRVFAGDGRSIELLTWSPDGSKLCSLNEDGVLRLWDVEASACIDALDGTPEDCEWLPDSSTVRGRARLGGGPTQAPLAQTGSEVPSLRAGDLHLERLKRAEQRTTQKLSKYLDPPDYNQEGEVRIESMSFSADRARVAAHTRSEWRDLLKDQVVVFDGRTSESLSEIEFASPPTAVALSPDGLHVSAVSGSVFRTWSANDDERGLMEWKGHQAEIRYLSWSTGNGDRIATADADGEVRIWGISRSWGDSKLSILSGRTVGDVSWDGRGRLVAFVEGDNYPEIGGDQHAPISEAGWNIEGMLVSVDSSEGSCIDIQALSDSYRVHILPGASRVAAIVAGPQPCSLFGQFDVERREWTDCAPGEPVGYWARSGTEEALLLVSDKHGLNARAECSLLMVDGVGRLVSSVLLEQEIIYASGDSSRWIACTAIDGSLLLVDGRGLAPSWRIGSPSPDSEVHVAHDPSSDRVVFGAGRQAECWNVTDLGPTLEWCVQLGFQIGGQFDWGGLEISPDGERVAILLDSGGGVAVLEAATGSLLFSRRMPISSGYFRQLRWSPDGRRLVLFGSPEGCVSVLESERTLADSMSRFASTRRRILDSIKSDWALTNGSNKYLGAFAELGMSNSLESSDSLAGVGLSHAEAARLVAELHGYGYYQMYNGEADWDPDRLFSRIAFGEISPYRVAVELGVANFCSSVYFGSPMSVSETGLMANIRSALDSLGDVGIALHGRPPAGDSVLEVAAQMVDSQFVALNSLEPLTYLFLAQRYVGRGNLESARLCMSEAVRVALMFPPYHRSERSQGRVEAFYRARQADLERAIERLSADPTGDLGGK
jgi:serine/threonine protein kinase/WD40 repeat protein